MDPTRFTWFGWRRLSGVWRWCRTTHYGGGARPVSELTTRCKGA